MLYQIKLCVAEVVLGLYRASHKKVNFTSFDIFGAVMSFNFFHNIH